MIKIATRRIKASSAKSAKRKASSKYRTVTKVNYIKGSAKKKGGKTFAVTTKKRKRKK